MRSALLAIYGNSRLCRIILVKVSIIAIATLVPYCTANAIEMKGMSYVGWEPNTLLSQASDVSLANIKQIGCNWVAVNVCWFQDDVNSTIIGPDYMLFSSTPESVIHAIDKCHQLGMKVMLKPLIELRDDTWRGWIRPSAQWFAAYQNFINLWADIAENHNCEMLCVGCEYANNTEWSSSWRSIVQDIHNHYTGSLVYAANPDEEKNIDWWDAIDYIGIDAYYGLADINNPTLAELETAWGSRADAIEAWRDKTWPNKQIIFTEVGYRSVNGVARAPWRRPSPPYQIDLQEQADCYNALLNECKDRKWWSGVFWWNWETDPNAGGLNDPYYTPQNKTAEAVLANYYVPFRSDLTRDSKVNFDDLRTFASYWLSYKPRFDIYPFPYGDGIIDYRDFAVMAKNWMVEVCLDGDINGDGKVNMEDLTRLTSRWLRTCKPGSLSEDINRDGHVDFLDYALVAGSWMQASPP